MQSIFREGNKENEGIENIQLGDGTDHLNEDDPESAKILQYH